MPFTELGLELTLDLLTDATNGINKVSIFTNIVELAKQDITFDAASGNESAATVKMTATDLVFNVSAGHIVQAVGLYQGTTVLVATYVFPTPYSFTNAGTFTLTDLTISLS